MKVIGIIAEYNPFHMGHAYQVRYAKETLGADCVIIVMSGPFTQRGTPAIFNKYERTAMALSCGADLVIELPVCYATASAEYFADAGIRLLDATGITDGVLFGCETPDRDAITKTAALLNEEPAAYRERLQQELAAGCSFPKARSLALSACGIDFPLTTANNILAVEYVKALQRRSSSMDFFCLQRQGEDYHSQDFAAEFASASALRHGIFTLAASNPCAASDYDAILSQIPEANRQQVSALLSKHAFIHPDDLSALLHYQLITDRDFTKYFDCSRDLANKINNCKFDFTTYTDFCDTLKSKNLTHARISRVLCHILLNITNNFMETALACETMPYLRILGFRKDAGELLTRISNAGSAPMVTSPADATKTLSPAGLSMLEKDIEAAHIYRCLQIEHGDKKTVGQNCPTEFTRKLLVVE